MERIETLNLKTETDALEAGHGITLYTFDELRGASMLAGFRRQLERNMRVRGIDPEGGQVERDARTIAEVETRPYVPSLFDLFEESIVEGVNRLESDGVEREARNAWERGMYREMLHAMKD